MKRRSILGASVGALAGTMLSRPLVAHTSRSMPRFSELPNPDDDRISMLISTAVDAAKSAGATYADARLSFTQQMRLRASYPSEPMGLSDEDRSENMTFGVRAQVDGYWGFAASPVWTKDEAARLGAAAVNGAKTNVLAKPRGVEMATNTSVTSGNWNMPVIQDPFEMDAAEIYDHLCGIVGYIDMLHSDYKLGHVGGDVKAHFYRQQKAFGSTDGQIVTQRVYRSGGAIFMQVSGDDGALATGNLPQITDSGCGFELFSNSKVRELIVDFYHELDKRRYLPVEPVEVGRFPVLLHPGCIAGIMKQSIGAATEVDRIMGYEANSTGTSYIVDPLESLGALKIGSPLMRVTATRSLPMGLTQAKWDDEGVEPKDFDVIVGGLLTDLHTDREGTSWIKEYLKKTGRPYQSNGGSYAREADDPQAVHPSDLRLHPDAARDTTLSQLQEQIENGLEFVAGSAVMDFQQSTGMLMGDVFHIRKGKRVARVVPPAMLFRTSELWGNLQALGGPSSALTIGVPYLKTNNFWKETFSSVSAPPALFKEMAIINPTQKA